MPRLAVFVSREQFPPNPDDQALLDACARLGVDAEPVIWDDGPLDGFDAGVIRATWDYSGRRAEYEQWLLEVDHRLVLHNSIETIRWSLDKRYLLDLERQGVPVIAQALVDAPDPALIREAAAGRGWDEYVVKSVVSAGGRQVALIRHNRDEEWGVALSRLHPGVPVLVQPFLSSIVDGEYSVMCIDGVATHAVLKKPAPGEFRVQDHYGGTVQTAHPPQNVMSLAERALEASGRPWTYARADVISSSDGPVLVELEMLEPELFLQLNTAAAERLARGLVR